MIPSHFIRGQVLSTDLVTSASIYLLLIAGVMASVSFSVARNAEANSQMALSQDALLLSQRIVMGATEPALTSRPRHIQTDSIDDLSPDDLLALAHGRDITISLTTLSGQTLSQAGHHTASPQKKTVRRIVGCDVGLCALTVTVQEGQP